MGGSPRSCSTPASTFDGLVARYARDDEQRDRILENRFYRNLAGALSGTQEYMAMERLHELHETGDYDLIIVDTPPTRHALDFLDAPQRLIRLLDNRVFKILMVPARRGFRVATAALHAFVRQVGRVIGTAVIDDIISFFRAFEGMEEGFRGRADAVRSAAHRADDELRARDVGPARLDRRGRLLRTATRRQRVRDQRARSRTGCCRSSPRPTR